MQSFLLGVPFVVVGFRDFKGILQSIQEFKTLELPRMVRNKVSSLKPVVSCHCSFPPFLSFPFLSFPFLSFPLLPSHSLDLFFAFYLIYPQPHAWDPLACLSFAEEILDFVQKELQATSSPKPITSTSASSATHPVYRISFTSPFSQIQLRELSEDETLDQVQGGDKSKGGIERIGFLPKVYYDFAMKK